ncbi:hypothetical protein KJZ71_03380 [Patescibacteria group bacterium]|nr:hypothetical protein [Patescibacteria group bacterium]MCL4732816.1 hypothetical protein [Patescibacteria group bacterium]MDL1953432.1 hypothetical protein [Candidatus Uhrbacteria bacterium UHB]RIL00588.1 MAG: hypothetical protein DCC77_03465 [Candidatus Uhrbacteria bacterium]
MSRKDSIQARQGKIKDALLEQLKRTPTLETACQKVGVARATVYRWIAASKKFAKDIDEAQREGRLFMSDVAENQLFSLIGEKKIEAIRLYLTTHNPRYGNKLELSGSLTAKDEQLSRSQKKLIREALRLSSLNIHGKDQKKNG